ncbi:MAG TPA: purine-nucleoside phosphorylase [Acidobacteriaceae bacterium]|nr:purine-nucleoside phosphorylase [Acidobacteriaceae bacterium]
MASTLFGKVSEAAEFVSARTPLRPALGIVLGSGLGSFAGQVEQPATISYAEIPHFPHSTVPGHGGRLVIGAIGGVPAAVMQGRVHAYEGYTSDEVTFPVRVLGRFGVKTLVLTNAAGGINEGLRQGQLVLISDHINLSGRNPVSGPHDERFGPRFFDMSDAYSARLRALAKEAAEDMDLDLEEGVYISVLGPSFESPAEIRAFRTMGADLVGMSTVQETIAARQMGIEVLGISCVTNLAAGIQATPLSHEEVLETGRAVEARLAELLRRVVAELA